MFVVLSPTWVLTDEHRASIYDKPVLMDRGTNEVYGPGDIVRPYPSWDFEPAIGAVVKLLGKTKREWTEAETNLIRSFFLG
jgi:hypothetical protein